MITLSIESSAKASSVALTRDKVLIAQYFQNSGLTHSRTLMQSVEDILRNNELTISDVTTVAAARGPGSFTGVRIGLAAAKGIAWGRDLPVRTVSTLHAAAAVFTTPDVIICPTMDARRGEVYNALFTIRNGELVRLCADRAIAAADLAVEAKSSTLPYLLTGDGSLLCAEAFANAGVAFTLAPELLRLQCAYGVALAALDESDISANDIEPNYLRVSQAERMREAGNT